MTVRNDGERLTIMLSAEETEDYEINGAFERCDRASLQSALIALLAVASEIVGFKCQSDSVIGEVYPGSDGGALISFTPARRKAVIRDRDCPVFEFDEHSDLLTAIEKIYLTDKKGRIRSALYKKDKRHRLLLFPSCGGSFALRIASEYCSSQFRGRYAAAKTREYWEPVIKENAVHHIGRRLIDSKCN